MIKILFMGRKSVAAKCLEYLASRKDIEVVGVLTDSHLDVSSTRVAAEKIGAPVLVFADALAAVESGRIKFDLGLSMLYWRKLKGGLITGAKRGVINFHPAPLPHYKGTAGYNLAILEGLSEWATSAHYVDESIDTGPIIEVSRFAISPERETAQSLEAISQQKLFDQFVRVINRALASQSRLATTANGPGRYVSRVDMEAMKIVRPGDDLERKTRAFWFPPYDGAFVEIDGKRYTLISRDMLQSMAPPGSSSLFSPPSS